MSLLEPAITGEASVAGDPALESRWERFEALLARASDRLNPILVKEARQALRSRQFTTTFFLMLAAGWAWSIIGLAMIGPAVYYSADGPTMFLGYHVILAFPLLVVAPYAAFHSLSAERQDRTHELVSITALGARQIISGKLCAVALQMAVYLSAIFPCLAFTYLLRGLDVFTIFLVVFYTVAMSAGLAMIGLLLATLAGNRQRQLGQSVIFALALFGAFWFNVVAIGALIEQANWRPDARDFWPVNLIFATIYLNAFALAFLAARAQLTTVCQNCSTALRVAIVVAQLSLIGWFAWGQIQWGTNVIYTLVFFSSLLWTLAGVFMTGEPPELSPRVKRDLPQSLLGRVFLTFFVPGPGTGYLLAVCSMLTVALVAALPYEWLSSELRRWAVQANQTVALNSPRPIRPGVFSAGIVAASYLAIYLGLGKLAFDVLRRYGEVRLMLRVLIYVLLVLVSSAVPWIIQVSNPATRNYGYTLLQLPSPVWTIWQSCVGGLPPSADLVIYLVPLAALLVFCLNLPGLARELRQVRVQKPPRVTEEDAEAAAVAAGPPQPNSPWG